MEPHTSSPGPSTAAGRRAALAALEGGASTAAVLAFHAALPAVGVAELRGTWRGSGLPTGHPLDGLLEALGWFGKRFDGPDDVHPLVFRDARGRLFAVDPAGVPLGLVLRCSPALGRPAVARLVRAALPLRRTRHPRARLRATEDGGIATATMSYDALPVDDVFRAVDDGTLVGRMDARGMGRPFFFVLRRQTLPWSSRRQ